MATAKLKQNIPRCVGIIMDGNRRWAKGKGMLPYEGHRVGYETLKETVTWAREAGVKDLIVYAFSTENWQRSKTEVRFFLALFSKVLKNMSDELHKEGVQVSFIGDRERFPEALQKEMARIEEETKGNKGIHLLVAVSYGGRAELARAATILTKKKLANISEKDIEGALFTTGIPDPDLIIRTGGEMRLSNFLLWQVAYSELFFTKTLWPDFSKREFTAILSEYASRERRRGK